MRNFVSMEAGTILHGAFLLNPKRKRKRLLPLLRPLPNFRCFVRASSNSQGRYRGPKPRRYLVADWVSNNDDTVRSLPIYVGGASLLAVLFNRAVSGIAPVADAESYLANLSLYPGRSELPFFPSNTQAVILQPIGDKGIEIIGCDTIRGFTTSDQAWITFIGEKVDATLTKHVINSTFGSARLNSKLNYLLLSELHMQNICHSILRFTHAAAFLLTLGQRYEDVKIHILARKFYCYS